MRTCLVAGLIVVLATAAFLNVASADVPIETRVSETGRLGYVMTGNVLAQDTDGDGRVDAQLQPSAITVDGGSVPAGAALVQAILYWSGSQTEAGGPCASGTDESIIFQAPGQPMQIVAADTSYCADGGSATYDMWVSRSDVTPLVSDLVGTYTVDGFSGRFLDGGTDNGSFAVVLIFEHSSLPWRTILLSDGIVTLANSNEPITQSGFDVGDVPGGTMTWYALDGDPTGTGTEQVVVDGVPGAAGPLTLSDTDNPATNPFNRTINTTSPVLTNAIGVDIDRFDLTAALSPGDTQLALTLNAGSDKYWFVAAVAGVDVVAPPCEPEWTARMDSLNAGFTGLEFYVGKAGSTEFTSTSFWAPLAGFGLDLAGHPWEPEVAALLTPDVFGTTGPEYASPAVLVGRTSSWLLEGSPSPLDQLLAGQPEAVLCMIGTNDITGTDGSGFIWTPFQANLEAIVDQIVSAGIIPMLVTIHPQLDRELLVKQVNGIICTVATAYEVPIVDFHAEVMVRQPGSWYGTLISADGINLNNGTGLPGVFTEANLAQNGYALLNFTCLRAFSEVYHQVLTNVPSAVIDNPSLPISLAQAYPNPFNPSTTIAFDIPRQEAVRLAVYDVSGRLVNVLIDREVASQGRNEVVWRGRDVAGRAVSAGVYFYRLEAGSYSETKRMVLVK